ncbi:hypothetical protein ABIB40_000537 [Pedobacter sp. UYP30]|uniref:hypothetical protein n=1 Tax=Pedobacter sp. UYP30 TaxID=1756400 RepID=UPI003398DD25
MEYCLTKKGVARGLFFTAHDPFYDISNRGSYCISTNIIKIVISAIQNNYNIKQASIKGGAMFDYYFLNTATPFLENKVLEYDKINNRLSVIVQPLGKPSLIFDGKSLFSYKGSGRNNLEMTLAALSGIKKSDGSYVYDPLPNGVYKVNRHIEEMMLME